VILEPILYAALMKVVLEVAGKGHYTLLGPEFSQANAALVLVSEVLGAPFYLEHFIEHLRGLACLHLHNLSPLKSLVEKVRDKAREKDCAQDEDNGRKGTDY
jgi:hypothetical protein